LVKELRSTGGVAEAAQVDALDEEAVNSYVDVVAEKAGSIDISFNLISYDYVQGTPLAEMSLEDFERPVITAVRTQFLTARAAARHMIRQGSGVILMFAFAIRAGESLMPLAVLAIFGGIANIFLSLAMLVHGLSRNPPLWALAYAAIGLAAVLSPLVVHRVRTLRWVPLVAGDRARPDDGGADWRRALREGHVEVYAPPLATLPRLQGPRSDQ
jgi:hypothetical protein